MNVDRSVTDFLLNPEGFTTIDVRSPGEYTDSHIPNAINIPLFSDEERAEVGTIYKYEGSKAAKWRAMEIVSPKLPSILSDIKDAKEEGKQLLLYCWRGGNRSQSVTLFAMMSGLTVQRLAGGYRAFREEILERIPRIIPKKAIVINGMTGTGKTEILHKLKDLGYPVLDLEAYANHRGSVFGAIGGDLPHSQKMFDALLYNDLSKHPENDYFFMEGESKRIGRAVQPPALYETKLNGIPIHIVSSLEERVERIYEQYVRTYMESSDFYEQVVDALQRIMKRMKSPDIQNQIWSSLELRNYKDLIRLLIVHYYDPRYDNKMNEAGKAALEVRSASIEEATKQIIAYTEKELHLNKVIEAT